MIPTFKPQYTVRAAINRENLSRYQELINGFHRAGLAMFGGFIHDFSGHPLARVLWTERTPIT